MFWSLLSLFSRYHPGSHEQIMCTVGLCHSQIHRLKPWFPTAMGPLLSDLVTRGICDISGVWLVIFQTNHIEQCTLSSHGCLLQPVVSPHQNPTLLAPCSWTCTIRTVQNQSLLFVSYMLYAILLKQLKLTNNRDGVERPKGKSKDKRIVALGNTEKKVLLGRWAIILSALNIDPIGNSAQLCLEKLQPFKILQGKGILCIFDTGEWVPWLSLSQRVFPW